jgi:DNA-binding response OmpR family regulator
MSADILVVSADPHVLSDRVTSLRRAGFSARASSSFPDARRMLEEGPAPEILVTDVRLGPYNGLHLVAVARVEFPRAFAIVIGGADHVLEVEATGLGARYLSGPVSNQALQATIAEVMAVERPRRRWPRKRLPTEVPAVVGGLPGRLLDVSYGGACIEVFGASMPSEAVDIVIPELGMDLRGMRVWAHRADPLQPVSFGVAISSTDQRWQQYVDGVAAA